MYFNNTKHLPIIEFKYSEETHAFLVVFEESEDYISVPAEIMFKIIKENPIVFRSTFYGSIPAVILMNDELVPAKLSFEENNTYYLYDNSNCKIDPFGNHYLIGIPNDIGFDNQGVFFKFILPDANEDEMLIRPKDIIAVDVGSGKYLTSVEFGN